MDNLFFGTPLYGGALGGFHMFVVTNHIEHGAPNTPYKNFIYTLSNLYLLNDLLVI